MAEDRVAFVSHSPYSAKKTAEQEVNEVLEKLGDVEIMDIDFKIHDGYIYTKIWYRLKSESINKGSPSLEFAPISKFTPETLRDPSIRKGGG